MEGLFLIIGELLTRTAVTKEWKYTGVALILICGIFAYINFTV